MSAAEDPRVRSAEARQQRVEGLFAGDAHVDLDALVRARSLDGTGRPGPGINARFATATVTQAFQANRRAQVAGLWAAHESACTPPRATGDDPADHDAWLAARRAAAEREHERRERLAAARAEEDRLQRLEDQAAATRRDDSGCTPAGDMDGLPLLAVRKRGRGSVGAAALSDPSSSASGDGERRVRDHGGKTKKKAKKEAKKHKRKHKHKHRRSRSP